MTDKKYTEYEKNEFIKAEFSRFIYTNLIYLIDEDMDFEKTYTTFQLIVVYDSPNNNGAFEKAINKVMSNREMKVLIGKDNK